METDPLVPRNNARSVAQADRKALHACLSFRYSYYVCERSWVPDNPSHPGLETDHYDAAALHLAVFQEQEVVAYLRVLPHCCGVGFMLDHDFAPLLEIKKGEALPREGAVELSRLVCRRDYLRVGKGEEPHPVELLLKLLYQESKAHGFHLFYIVVEEAWLKPFARRFGLPFRVLGQPYTFPDGTRTVAAVATLEELEAGMRQHSAAKYEWYQRAEEPEIKPKSNS